MINMHLNLFVLFLAFPVLLLAQSVKKMEYELEIAKNDRERLILQYKLAAAYLEESNWEKAELYGSKAHKLSLNMGQYGAAAQTAFIAAKAMGGQARNDRKNAKKWDRQAQSWLNTALTYAKRSNNGPLVLQVNGVLAEQAEKERDYRKAARFYADGYRFFNSQEQQKEMDGNQLQEVMRLQAQIDKLTYERDSLRNVVFELEQH